MDEKAFTDPVSILRKIEESCRVSCATEPQQSTEIFSQWSCVAFRVGKNSLSVSLDEVVEILDMPKLTRVPLAQTWVCGIANIRGNLLPVVDFSGFLNGEVTCPGEKTRVLVIDYNGVYSGLVVDEVYGLKHFMESEYTDVKPEIDEFLLPYVRNGFYRDGKMWHAISLFALAESTRFMMAAV